MKPEYDLATMKMFSNHRVRRKWIGTSLCCTLLAACAQAPDSTNAACATPLDARVPNSCVVVAQTLWRGARPDKVAAETLVQLGVKTVVNLELLNDDKAAFQDANFPQADAREIGYFRAPDWEPLAVMAPKEVDEHVTRFLAIARTQPEPIYVHCRSGQNRTGIMVAAFRVFNGTSIDDAIADMKGYGGIWFDHDAAYVRSLTAQRRDELEAQIAAWIPRLRRDATLLCANGKCTVAAN